MWKRWMEEMGKMDVGKGKVKVVEGRDGEGAGDGCWEGGNAGRRR